MRVCLSEFESQIEKIKEMVRKGDVSGQVKAQSEMIKIGVNQVLLNRHEGVWSRPLNLNKAKERCQKAHPDRKCVPTYQGEDKYPSGYMVECPAYNKKIQIGISYQCKSTVNVGYHIMAMMKSGEFSITQYSYSRVSTFEKILKLLNPGYSRGDILKFSLKDF